MNSVKMLYNWEQTFLAWGRRKIFREKVAKTISFMQNIALKYHTVGIAFSGGKDSTVMLSLAQKTLKKVKVLMYDFGRLKYKRYNVFPEELVQEIVRNAYAISRQKILRITKLRNFGGVRENIDIVEEMEELRIIPDEMHWIEGQQKIAKEEGCDVMLVGLRKEESYRRRRRINSQQKYVGIGGISEEWPLQDWEGLDVWAYIVQNNLPYPSIYDKKAQLVGCSYLDIRLASFFRGQNEKGFIDNTDGILIGMYNKEK